MKTIFKIFLFLYTSYAIGQQNQQYNTDTTINFKKEISKYYFNLEGGKQGFYWGVNNQLTLKEFFVFHIKNNSKDRIVIDEVGEGNSIVKMKSIKKLPLVLQPQDTLEIFASILTHEVHIDFPIQVFFKRNEVNDTLTIPTWQNKMRSHLLRIYQDGRDISRRCKVYAQKNGVWKPLEVNDSIIGYYFFIVQAPQDETVKVKIDFGQSKMKETLIYTSRGANGYIYHELSKPSFHNHLPAGFFWKPSRLSPHQYCIVSKEGGAIYDSSERIDSIQKLINLPKQSFNKEMMTITVLKEKDAHHIDQCLRNSEFEMKLFPTTHSAQLLSDVFTIFFTTNTSPKQIAKLFKKAGIKTYSPVTSTELEKRSFGNAQKYQFRVESIVNPNLLEPLVVLWNSPSVKFLRQQQYRNPYLPTKLDLD